MPTCEPGKQDDNGEAVRKGKASFDLPASWVGETFLQVSCARGDGVWNTWRGTGSPMLGGW